MSHRESDRAFRVLQVHHGRYPRIQGGVDRVVTELVQELGPEEAVLFEPGAWEDRSLTVRDIEGVTVYRKRLRSFGGDLSWYRRIWSGLEALHTLWQLACILRRQRIDIVHLHTLQDYQSYFALLARLGLCRCVVTLHRNETLVYPNRPRAQRDRWRRVLSACVAVTSVSETLAGLARERLPLTSEPITIHNGISDPAVGLSDGVRERRPRPYAVCVGALSEYKGHDVAVDAWSLLRDSQPDLDLLIIGDGELDGFLRQRVEHAGVPVHFIGALPIGEVLSVVSDACVFVMPSRNEGLGVALLEAMALSRPVVASDIPVFREVVEPGRSGVLFRSEDPEALAAAVAGITDSPDQGASLGRGGREKFLRSFTAARMAADYRSLYRKVASGDVPVEVS